MSTSLTTYDEKWAALAKEFVTQVPKAQSGDRLSIKGGVFSLDGKPIGTRLCAVILDSIAVNTYFSEKWVDGVKTSPKCYAFGRDGAAMMPHIESMSLHKDYFVPQHITPDGHIGGCSGCPQNVYGTAPNGGKGKACQNRQNLALLSAGQFVPQKGGYGHELQLFDDPAHFAATELVKLSLPVTSGSAWGEYVRKVQGTTNRPPFGVVSVIELLPHPKFQIQVGFTMVEAIPDHLFTTIMERRRDAHDGMVQPFSPPKTEDDMGADVPF